MGKNDLADLDGKKLLKRAAEIGKMAAQEKKKPFPLHDTRLDNLMYRGVPVVALGQAWLKGYKSGS